MDVNRKQLVLSSYSLRSGSLSRLSRKAEGEGKQPPKAKPKRRRLMDSLSSEPPKAKSKDSNFLRKSKRRRLRRDWSSTKSSSSSSYNLRSRSRSLSPPPDGEGEGEVMGYTKAMVLKSVEYKRCLGYYCCAEDDEVESDGFDVTDSSRSALGPILPMDAYLHCNKWKLFPRWSRDSLGLFNDQYETNYQLVKVVKANSLLVAGHNYYITFEAKEADIDDDEAAATTFQAEVYQDIPESNTGELSQFTLVRMRDDKEKQVGPVWNPNLKRNRPIWG